MKPALPKEDKLRFLTWDVESAPKTAYVWRLGDQRVDHSQLITDSFLLCIAWKWHGEKKTYAVQLTPREAKKGNDKRILQEFSKVLEEADYYIGHNIDGFDVKMVNSGLIKHGLAPIPPSQTIDTLKVAKKYFKFASNKLGAVCRDLGLEGKANTGGFQTWVDCMQGCPKAMKRMVKYNKQDVAINEKLFDKLRPYIKFQHRLGNGAIADTEKASAKLARHICCSCGHKGLYANKKYVTKSGNVSLTGRCPECGSSATINIGKQ